MNKIDRKLKKLQHVLFKQTGALGITTPSRHLAICNSGLVNGLSEETILKHFSKFGRLEKIILIPEKSCCFFSYQDVDSSIEAFNVYNGKLNIAQNGKPIYLLYVDVIPDLLVTDEKWGEIPSGLVIFEDFITEDEENSILELCDFNQDLLSNELKNRQVKHYGYEFRYDTNNVDKDEPLKEKIPSECDFLWKRLRGTCFENFLPDQLTVNHYSPGQGIPHHVDTHSAFEDYIVSLSLKSSVVMDLKRENKHVCVVLPRRSLCVMSGESRYDWTHGITPRKFDVVLSKSGYDLLERSVRVSYTFRKILQGECTCQYKLKCDSYNRLLNKSKIENDVASKLEREHVHSVYENIATHFSDTRHKPWPNVLEFINSFETGSVLFDVGCGNGKYLGQNRNIFKVGCDTSLGLIDVCRDRGFEAFQANCLHLPLRDLSVDGVLSIAVIHHLANEDRRLQAIKEIVRVLKVCGKALIYVWAKDQYKDSEQSSYIKQDRKNRSSKEIIVAENRVCQEVVPGVTLPVHVNRTQFTHKDVLVPWILKTENKTGDTFLRYYHVFEENELEMLCGSFVSLEVIKNYYDQGNWCVIVRKKG